MSLDPSTLVMRRHLQQFTRVKEAAAIAFHKANHDLAVRAAALRRARVETEELNVGDYAYYWKPADQQAGSFPMAWTFIGGLGVEQSPGQASKIYWIVHGSSMLRCTRQQLRLETVPERYERQSQPDYAPSLSTTVETTPACSLYGPCGDPYEPSMLQHMVILQMKFLLLLPIHLPRMLQNLPATTLV